ncbi:MAG TPA: hypothetical protein VGI99_13155 [Gemmataceae bacterium]|jgi:hypothetical protein
MNGNRTNYGGGGCGLLREKDAKRKAPRVVLAGGPGFAASAADYLYLMGLDVCSAATPADLHALAIRNRTAAVVLPVEAGGESGFLTCAKLRLSRPKLKIVLVGEPTPRSERFARFVGAGFSTETDAANAVLRLI